MVDRGFQVECSALRWRGNAADVNGAVAMSMQEQVLAEVDPFAFLHGKSIFHQIQITYFHQAKRTREARAADDGEHSPGSWRT